MKLREEDVPGAILPRTIPEECTMEQTYIFPANTFLFSLVFDKTSDPRSF